jgi:hypothetical protein
VFRSRLPSKVYLLAIVQTFVSATAEVDEGWRYARVLSSIFRNVGFSLAFRIHISAFGVNVKGLEERVEGFGVKNQGLESKIMGSGCIICGSVFTDCSLA